VLQPPDILVVPCGPHSTKSRLSGPVSRSPDAVSHVWHCKQQMMGTLKLIQPILQLTSVMAGLPPRLIHHLLSMRTPSSTPAKLLFCSVDTHLYHCMASFYPRSRSLPLLNFTTLNCCPVSAACQGPSEQPCSPDSDVGSGRPGRPEDRTYQEKQRQRQH